MSPFRRFRGVLAPLLRANIDTDAIIPSREMKRVSREGLGVGLFAAWRYADVTARTPNREFVLNQPAYANASILATGRNFGCGSSREHAVWALQDFGIRAILAPEFGAIFERNCFNNGLLPLRLDESLIAQVISSCSPDPQTLQPLIDLDQQLLEVPGGQAFSFTVPEIQRQMLVNGWDPVDRTAQLQDRIDGFLERDRAQRPWVYELENLPRS